MSLTWKKTFYCALLISLLFICSAQAQQQQVYVIKHGDSLCRIAARNKLLVRALVKANPGVNKRTRLQIGDTLILPANSEIAQIAQQEQQPQEPKKEQPEQPQQEQPQEQQPAPDQPQQPQQPEQQPAEPGQTQEPSELPSMDSFEAPSEEAPKEMDSFEAPAENVDGQFSKDDSASKDLGGSKSSGSRLPFHVSGFFQTIFSPRFGDDPRGCQGLGCDLVLGQERLRTELDGNKFKLHFKVKNDFFYDAVIHRFDYALREAYFDFRIKSVGVRAGRQILTEGIGDLLYLNDVFPKDFVNFTGGYNIDYVKKGSDAVKVDTHTRFFDIEVAGFTHFRDDNFSDQRRLFGPDPFPQITNRPIEKPAVTFGNMEWSVKVSRSIRGWDVAGYAFKGFFHFPSFLPAGFVPVGNTGQFAPTRFDGFFPRVRTYGGSVQGNALGGLLGFETVFVDSREDRQGTNPFVLNSLYRFLVIHQRNLAPNFFLFLEYQGEYMLNYDNYVRNQPAVIPLRPHYSSTIGFRLMKLLKYEALKIFLFGIAEPELSDGVLNPEISYKVNDRLTVASGANIFMGKFNGIPYGQKGNSNIYFTAKYFFSLF